MKKIEMIDVPIGGVIERFGKKYKCIKPNKLPINYACRGCAFSVRTMHKVCETLMCTRSRRDGEYVIFKEVK